jgi:hypothetical protein
MERLWKDEKRAHDTESDTFYCLLASLGQFHNGALGQRSVGPRGTQNVYTGMAYPPNCIRDRFIVCAPKGVATAEIKHNPTAALDSLAGEFQRRVFIFCFLLTTRRCRMRVDYFMQGVAYFIKNSLFARALAQSLIRQIDFIRGEEKRYNQGKFQRPAQVEQLIKRYEEEGPAANGPPTNKDVKRKHNNTRNMCVMLRGSSKKERREMMNSKRPRPIANKVDEVAC